MEFVLNFSLNYIALTAAGCVFVILLIVLLAKRKSLSKIAEHSITVLMIVLIIYFSFIIWITIAAGKNQPANPPSPMPSQSYIYGRIL